MKVPKNVLFVALALAGGIAVGAAGSTIAAGPAPAPTPPANAWVQMGEWMSGWNATGMMSGAGMMGSAGTSFGPGMMGNPADPGRAAQLAKCDELHDAMHAALGASPDPSDAPSLRDPSDPRS